MSFLIIFALLAIKHAILTNTIDIGYSESRSTRVRGWRVALALAKHLGLEAAASLLILRHSSLSYIELFVGLEAMGQLACCLIERRSPPQRLLKVHLICEASYLLYLIVLVILLRP